MPNAPVRKGLQRKARKAANVCCQPWQQNPMRLRTCSVKPDPNKKTTLFWQSQKQSGFLLGIRPNFFYQMLLNF
jgi:hypothetical protein